MVILLIKDDGVLNYLLGGDRFLRVGGYVFDRLIFVSYIFVCLVFFVSIFFVYGMDKSYHIYYVCDADASQGFRCEQPFFMNYPLCESVWDGACVDRFVSNGFSFGEPAPWIVYSFGWIVGVCLFLCFLFNHLLYNRDFKFVGGD